MRQLIAQFTARHGAGVERIRCAWCRPRTSRMSTDEDKNS
jgi:hypothetical protein